MVEFEIIERKLVCHLKGRMGADNCELLDENLGKKLKEINTTFASTKEVELILDLKEVEYIASAFIRKCLVYAKKMGKNHFSIINTSPLIKRTFKIAGLEDSLNVS